MERARGFQGQSYGQPLEWTWAAMDAATSLIYGYDGSMFEAMKMGTTASSRPADGGLLGPLMRDGGLGGSSNMVFRILAMILGINIGFLVDPGLVSWRSSTGSRQLEVQSNPC